MSLADARHAKPSSVTLPADSTPAPTPPAGVLELAHYPAIFGDNVAYVTPVKPGPKRPGIVWITGGFDWGISEGAWMPQPLDNDQSARAFREAGIAMILPSLRGSNGNPGHNECLLGEIDDILAAARWFATRPDVDPARVYIGGHSTGGTATLLTVESTDMFRAAFAFGPVADIRHYGPICLPERAPLADILPRAPWAYASTIHTPTWIIEGSEDGNADSIAFFMEYVGRSPVHTLLVPDRTHFSVLGRATKTVARAILADQGATPNFNMTVEALAKGE